jgi:hypothetical protein
MIAVVCIEMLENESVEELIETVALKLHQEDLAQVGKVVQPRKIDGYQPTPVSLQSVETFMSWLEAHGMQKKQYSAKLIHFMLTEPCKLGRVEFEEDERDLQIEMKQLHFIDRFAQGWELNQLGRASHLVLKNFSIKWALASDTSQRIGRGEFISSYVLGEILKFLDRGNPDGMQHENGQWYMEIPVEFLEEDGGGISGELGREDEKSYRPFGTPVGELILSGDYDPETETCQITVHASFINELRRLCGWDENMRPETKREQDQNMREATT